MLSKKKVGVMIAGLLMFSQCSIPAFAGTWEQGIDDGKPVWQYINDDGSYFTNGWLKDNNKWYLFAHGEMEAGKTIDARGLNQGDTNQYYLCADGHMADGGFFDLADNPNEEMVFTDTNGHTIIGLFMVNGALYHSGDLNGLINKGKLQIAETQSDYEAHIYYGLDAGKLVDKNGQPFVANAKFYSLHKDIPMYDSKGNLIGRTQN